MSRLSIEEIKEELDMEFFLERESAAFRVTRGVSGVQLNIKTCPNPECGDDRWRTYFGLETGKGNCFVCSTSFDAVSFIHLYMNHSNTEWGATFREIEGVLKEQGYRPKRQITVAVDPGEVKLPSSLALPTEDGENLKYLEDRGFGTDIASYFHLRYCEFGWWHYRDAEGNALQQSFANRVIIPVYDLEGKLATFQGRDVLGTSSMKYLFPKELPGTGRYLLNGQNVVATTEVVMGEGIFDVAATMQALHEDAGLRHIVPIGSFGKHLSYGSPTGDDQLGAFIKLRRRGVKIVTIMWDGGTKELLAALNAAKLLTGVGLTVRVALLPHGKDPNEVPPEVTRQAYYKATVWTPALDIKWRLRSPYASAETAAKVSKR